MVTPLHHTQDDVGQHKHLLVDILVGSLLFFRIDSELRMDMPQFVSNKSPIFSAPELTERRRVEPRIPKTRNHSSLVARAKLILAKVGILFSSYSPISSSSSSSVPYCSSSCTNPSPSWFHLTSSFCLFTFCHYQSKTNPALSTLNSNLQSCFFLLKKL